MTARHNQNEPGTLPDDDIIRRILAGYIDDFEILLERYRGYVFTIASGLLPIDAVDDLAHDVFVEAYRSLPKFREGTSFKKWLAGITIHSCQDHWRRHYRSLETPLSALTDEHDAWIDAVAAGEASEVFAGSERQKEARDILQHALSGLSVKDRMVLTLVHLEGLSIREAAEALGWSTINVKVRAHRSREKMRRRIAALLEEGVTP